MTGGTSSRDEAGPLPHETSIADPVNVTVSTALVHEVARLQRSNGRLKRERDHLAARDKRRSAVEADFYQRGLVLEESAKGIAPLARRLARDPDQVPDFLAHVRYVVDLASTLSRDVAQLAQTQPSEGPKT